MITTLEIDLATKLRDDIRSAIFRYYGLAGTMGIGEEARLEATLAAVSTVMLEIEDFFGVNASSYIARQRKAMHGVFTAKVTIMRKPGQRFPSDYDHLVRIQDAEWEKLGPEAWPRGMSRGRLVRSIVEFVLDNPEILKLLLDGEEELPALGLTEVCSDQEIAAE